jgi:hypothetical protein
VADVDEIVLDVDAALLPLDSEGKAGYRRYVQGRVRVRAELCFVEPLGLAAGILRGGGATADNAADQLAVIDQAIGSLPEGWRAGHHDGDDPGEVERRLRVRADTAGGTAKVVTKGLTSRNSVLSVGMRARTPLPR